MSSTLHLGDQTVAPAAKFLPIKSPGCRFVVQSSFVLSSLSNLVRLTMPGHVKKTTGPDPDPSPWLVVSPELKTKLKAKPYDTKKSVWVSTEY